MSIELRPHARVLIVRLSALGDVLFALETVAALARARPDVTIDFLIEDRFAGLLADHPEISELRVYPRQHRLRIPGFLRRLRRTRYDAILDLHGILKSAVPVWFAKAAVKLGYAAPGAREGAHRVYDVAVPLPDPLPHRADRGRALLRAVGVEAERCSPTLPAPAVARDPFWRDDAHPRVVLHPGASAFAAFKRWPAAKFGALARALVDEGADVAISFGPGESDLASEIATLAPGARQLDGTAIGLLGLAGVMRGADAVVAADTGPLHIAAAAGARVIALFGPKDPELYGPRGAGHTVLWHDVPCRPCRRRDCVSPQCILGIPVEAVIRAVRATVTDRPRARENAIG